MEELARSPRKRKTHTHPRKLLKPQRNVGGAETLLGVATMAVAGAGASAPVEPGSAARRVAPPRPGDKRPRRRIHRGATPPPERAPWSSWVGHQGERAWWSHEPPSFLLVKAYAGAGGFFGF